MATFITHLVTGGALGTAAYYRGSCLRYAAAAALLSALPDIDTIAFIFGIPYEHCLGHRGFTHSILFAVIAGVLAALIVERKHLEFRRFLYAALVFFLAVLVHDLIDAMTNGGLGVGFFIPFSDKRFFFPWRPIPVSPIRVRDFISGAGHGRLFTARASFILMAEAKIVILPAVISSIIIVGLRRLFLPRGRKIGNRTAPTEASIYKK